jgi:hypothetical protein
MTMRNQCRNFEQLQWLLFCPSPILRFSRPPVISDLLRGHHHRFLGIAKQKPFRLHCGASYFVGDLFVTSRGRHRKKGGGEKTVRKSQHHHG